MTSTLSEVPEINIGKKEHLLVKQHHSSELTAK